MDPRRNPFAPGAGTPPPQLAGRDEIIERISIALDRIRGRFPARSFILHGLRGVGKTVLLNHVRSDAQARGFACSAIEAPEGRSLPAMLAPALRSALMGLDQGEALTQRARRALRALAGFVQAVKLKYGDVEVNVDVEPERGLADSGDLETDLTQLIRCVGEAAQERDTAYVMFIDELQYVVEDEFAALIRALHEAAQASLPIAMVGAGLPQVLGQAGRAKSYAERLFEFVLIDRLDAAAAEAALRVPAQRAGVDFTNDAVGQIIGQTSGYPYFLQEWGKHAWNIAPASPITGRNAEAATAAALAELDASFFRVRFYRLTSVEKRYLRAMADLGPGVHRSGDVAARLGRQVTSVAPVRGKLIRKGMIHSPGHGETAFTVPLFDGFMRRIMPTLP